MPYISGYEVAHGRTEYDMPPNSVGGLDGSNNDINLGFGVRYVWIVPTTTTNRDEAVTSFEIKIQKSPMSTGSYPDLAEGAGGSYRYLIPKVDKKNPKKITKLALYRTKDDSSTPPFVVDGMTTDINEGRGGDFLYLCWRYDCSCN